MLERVNGIHTKYEDSAILVDRGVPFTGIKYFTYLNGQIQKERSYYKGRETGFDRSWYPNGSLRFEMPRRGSSSVLEFYKEWHSNGQLKGEGVLEHGITISSKSWNEDGKSTEEWELEPDESEPMYRALKISRKNNCIYPLEFLKFEIKIKKYLSDYPSSKVYYEKDFLDK
jgi:hypothetical protein